MKKLFAGIKVASVMMKQLAAPYFRLILLQVLTCGIVFAFADLIQPILYSVLFNSLQNADMLMIVKGCTGIGGLILGMMGIEYLNDVILDTNLFRAMNAVSIQSAGRYHKLQYYATTALDEGDVYNRLYQGGRQLPSIWITIMMAIADFLGILVLIIMCLRISMAFSVAAFVFSIAILIRVKIQAQKTERYTKMTENAKGDLERYVYSAIHDMEFAAVNGVQDHIVHTYQKQRDILWDIKGREMKTESIISALYELFDHSMRIIAPFLMLKSGGNNAISYGAATSTFSILESLRENVPSLSGRIEEVTREFTPIERLSDLLGVLPEADSHCQRPRLNTAAISVRNLTLYKEGKCILRDISFDIPAGEKVAIIGKNGCGKSTLLRAMLGLYKPDEGSVTIDKEYIVHASHEQKRAIVSYAPARSQLFSESVKENIVMGADKDEEAEFVTAANYACVEQSLFPQLGNELSGGQAQRTNIARALIHNTPILVLDEPTASIDERQSNLILEAIIQKEATAIVVTHDAGQLHFFDRILLMRDQRIVADGAFDQIKNSNAFADWLGERLGNDQ